MSQQDRIIQIEGKETAIHAEHPVEVVCLEHVEEAIDDYVNQYEVAPDTFPLEKVADPAVGHNCAVCGQPGAVVLLHVKGL
ncbi:CxxH/CxxC protein [Brevibacillus fulvus]|uniref:CxxH/CxxC protein (TIGR04129 family) n=1 Tax=Brevibacillus fulvus TaxID=1125967 RepID=A0A938Y1V8_9BACL|nr:CxxH/CxxC protein [Brevibacillus fulvus]MBM7591785.1 CxxH/CxxC protein (TIGR04129 family) [Brevibacillus fulvus]